ncbi:BolA family protein [Magnetospirillum molischianum]|uniref:Transcriptional regulator n=1 Tax=Magnetospirillum molischianum DSM 120 TaxID=1150626 RepID=H8FRN8_MAGML|nr:BolA family protein [Magnetospirillum molischianum]CCG41026.1 Transcriptional regulator [Magnetospirillum molischianum DSM 120]
MHIAATLRRKLEQSFAPSRLDVTDESARHAGHGAHAGKETHFALVVVSDAFTGKSRVERHRMVHSVLAEELVVGGVHALALTALTPQEDRAA